MTSVISVGFLPTEIDLLCMGEKFKMFPYIGGNIHGELCVWNVRILAGYRGLQKMGEIDLRINSAK